MKTGAIGAAFGGLRGSDMGHQALFASPTSLCNQVLRLIVLTGSFAGQAS